MAKRATSRRIIEFDLLRGFFIMVITLDHLAYWPSPLAFFSGKGWLWVSSAEGFFLISGFLIGFIRAYKGRHKDLWQITKSLWPRPQALSVGCGHHSFPHGDHGLGSPGQREYPAFSPTRRHHGG